MIEVWGDQGILDHTFLQGVQFCLQHNPNNLSALSKHFVINEEAPFFKELQKDNSNFIKTYKLTVVDEFKRKKENFYANDSDDQKLVRCVEARGLPVTDDLFSMILA